MIDFTGHGIFLLKQSMNYLNQFRDNNDQNYLYLSVLTLIKATELFAKEILLQENELLIYKNFSDKGFLKFYIRKCKQRFDGELHFCASNTKVASQLIDYREALIRLKLVLNLDDEAINICKNLERYEKELLNVELNKKVYRIESSVVNVYDLLIYFLDKIKDVKIEEMKRELQEFVEEDKEGCPNLWISMRT